MIQSGKPRKQRHFRFNAPMHERQHFVHAHVDKALRQRLNLGRRTVQVSKGDTVKVVSGKNRGKTGKIVRVDMRKCYVYIDSLKRKNAKGKESEIHISSSNVYITDLNLSDSYRANKLKLKAIEEPKQKAAAKQALPEQQTGNAVEAEAASK